MARPCDAFLPPDLPASAVQARVGVVSDTHAPSRSMIPSGVFSTLAGVDMVLHPGDADTLGILDELSSIAPVVAVHGNSDEPDVKQALPYSLVLSVAGRRLLLCHGHRADRDEESRANQITDWPTKLAWHASFGRRVGADVVVFGHVHVPMAVTRDDVLLVNPGAIGPGHVVFRPGVRGVALLFATRDGSQVVHVDVDKGTPFNPALHLDEDYWATIERWQPSILSEELHANWRAWWHDLRAIARDPTYRALRRLAEPRWFGSVDSLITRTDLLGELSAELSHAELARCEDALDRWSAA